MPSLTSAVLDEIRRDLASFSDPGTPVLVGERGTVQWTRERTEHTAQLVDGGARFPDVDFNGRRLSYASFLASEAMADLRDLATSILGSIPPVDHYLPGPARAGDPVASEGERGSAEDLLIKSSTNAGTLPFNATRVLFLQGNAGTGKTSVLRQVTRAQAERYLRGEASVMFLYLDAQGKGLAQLEDVMARALQDLRARFTYHSVATLTRRMCLVPVVDGFDELIGPSSAREALGNLAKFLAQLDREGAIIASSRSAFIDYRTLHARAAEISKGQGLAYEIHPITVLPWEDNDVYRYVSSLAVDTAELARFVGEMLRSESATFVRKPFFLAHIADIVLHGQHVEGGQDVVQQVVDAALSRETDKLKDRQLQPLLTPAQHREFCTALAEEMWFQQAPDLDCDTIRVIAEICADQFGLGGQDAKTFVDRSIAHGLLTPVRGGSERREFEHELLRFEFQAGRLAGELRRHDGALRDYLLRADLPADVVLRIPAYQPFAPLEVVTAIDRLSQISAASRNSSIAASNSGAVTASLLRDRADLPTGLRASSLYLRGTSLGRCHLSEAVLTDCVLDHVDLSKVSLRSCSVRKCTFIACSVSDESRFDKTRLSSLAFPGLLFLRGELVEETYDPQSIAEVLRLAGALLDTEQPGESRTSANANAVALVEKLLKHARSHFYLSRNDAWVKRQLLEDAKWDTVERLLKAQGLLEEVSLTKSGRPEPFMRLTLAPDLILEARSAGSGDSSTAPARFWKSLAEVA